MDLQELQNALNGNRIDLRQLNTVQRIIIDRLQKKGVLETEPLETLQKSQYDAAKKIAKKKNMTVDPIRTMTADKLNRNKVKMYSDLGFLFGQLLYDRKRLAGAILNPGKYLREIEKITPNFSKGVLNKFVVGLKQIKAMAQGYGPAATATALRSAIFGTVGWTGGGLAYDTADEITRDLMDLKNEVGVKTYKEMSNQNQLVRSLDDMRVGLTFNAGAELLGPLTGAGMYGLRKMFGLESEYSRHIAQVARQNNLKANYIMMADPKSIGGQFLKKVNKVFGQLPFIGGPAKRAQDEAIEQFNQISQKVFNMEPGMHFATMAAASEQAAEQMLKNYSRFHSMNKINYNRAIDMAKAYGDPFVIELNEVKSIMKQLETDALTPPEIKIGFTDPQRLQTPFGQFYDAYAKLVNSGRKISMTEYIDLRELLNASTNMLYKNDKSVMIYGKLQKALETDFARMNLDPATKINLKYPVISKTIIESAGGTTQAGMAESTIGKIGLTQDGKANIKTAIEDAFGFYANKAKTFESRVARIASKFDENAISLKGLQGFSKAGNIEKDQMLRVLSRNVFQLKDSFSFNAITDLQKLLDADVYKILPTKTATGTEFKVGFETAGSKEGNATLERLFGAYIGDAYQKSFRLVDKDQFGDWIGSWLMKESDRAVNTGMSKSLNELLMPNGQLAKNIGKGNLRFDPDIFRKQVLPNEAAAKQFEVIFGAQKARKLLDGFNDMLSYMDAVKSYAIPSGSQFLARRLILTGGMGVGMYGLGLPGTIIMLFLGRYANKALSNPQAMNVINSEFKSFMAGGYGKSWRDPIFNVPVSTAGTSSFARLMTSRLANYFMSPETGKKYGTEDVDINAIFDHLENTNVPIDDLKDLHMDLKEKENLFPTLTDKEYADSIDTLPPPEDLATKIGGLPANREEEAMMRRAVNQMPANQPITPTTLPRQAGLRMPGAGMQKPDYSALFPFDTLGGLVADRRDATTPQPRNPNVQRQS